MKYLLGIWITTVYEYLDIAIYKLRIHSPNTVWQRFVFAIVWFCIPRGLSLEVQWFWNLLLSSLLLPQLENYKLFHYPIKSSKRLPYIHKNTKIEQIYAFSRYETRQTSKTSQFSLEFHLIETCCYVHESLKVLLLYADSRNPVSWWWSLVKFCQKTIKSVTIKESTVWSTDSDSWVKKVTFIKHIQKFQKRTKLVLNLDVTISSLTCNTKIVILIGKPLFWVSLKEQKNFQVKLKV